MLQPGRRWCGKGIVWLLAVQSASSRGRELLARLAGAVFRDPELVVDTGGAHGTGEQVGAPAVGCGADDAGERDFAVVDLDVDHRAAAARGNGERAVLFDAVQNQVLQLVVVQHPGFSPAYRFCSDHGMILWEKPTKLLSILHKEVSMKENGPIRGIRLALLAVLLLGLAGSLTELLLIAHDEDVQQMIPVVLMAVGIAVVAWNLIRPGAVSIRSLQVLMVAFIAAGGLGVFYHYQANVEFQVEVDPGLSGTALLWTVLQAKSPPALSPGLMVQLGLIGLIFSWGHPALTRPTQGEGT